jgi:hypothetical protein
MSFIWHRKAFWELPLLMTGLPLAGKFPCKRKFWPVQNCARKRQGNQIYQEMARKFEPGQGNCEES